MTSSRLRWAFPMVFGKDQGGTAEDSSFLSGIDFQIDVSTAL